MKVLVWGAGAIGGTVGAYLVRAGHEVTFVDVAAEHVRAIDEGGLAIEGPIAEFSVRAPAFEPDALEGVFEWVLLCTKAQHTDGAARMLAPHLADDGVVVSVQNGLNEPVIAAVVGWERVLGAFVNFGADYLEPGRIHYGGRGAVVLGEWDGRDTPRLRELQRVFLDFDDAAVASPNIQGFLWGKLAYGAMLFATALTHASIAEALDAAEFRAVHVALAREVLRVAAAQGIVPEGFNGFDPAAFAPGTSDEVAMRSIDEMVAFNRRSAKTHSGIWRDLAVRKRKTEAEAQLGPIVRHGAEVGVPTPLTARLIELVHDVEEGRRPQGWETLAALGDAIGTSA